MREESTLGMLVTMRAHCFASVQKLTQIKVMKPGSPRTCMTTRRSAFPVRISYRVNVRSEPMLASTEDSARLKRTADIVSMDVGKVRLDIGALLLAQQLVELLNQKTTVLTSFHPRPALL